MYEHNVDGVFDLVKDKIQDTLSENFVPRFVFKVTWVNMMPDYDTNKNEVSKIAVAASLIVASLSASNINKQIQWKLFLAATLGTAEKWRLQRMC